MTAWQKWKFRLFVVARWRVALRFWCWLRRYHKGMPMILIEAKGVTTATGCCTCRKTWNHHFTAWVGEA